MEYITVKEASAKWNFAQRSIQNYCANEKIPGAKCVGGQWFIPYDAVPPPDGRTKAAKKHRVAEYYRFPVFIYSGAYGDPSGLTAEGQCLLQAQKLRLEGDFLKSISLCRKLLEDKLPPCFTAGAYLTIGVNSLPLGLISEYRDAVSKLEKLTAAEDDHKEDYRLMTAALKFYTDWNSSGIREICPSGLSADAAWYYRMQILAASVFSGNAAQTTLLRYVETEFPALEKTGMTPVQCFVLGILGVSKDSDRTQEEKNTCLRRAVELAAENSWDSILMRFYAFSHTAIEEFLKPYGEPYLDRIRRMNANTVKYWNIAHSAEPDSDGRCTLSSNQIELLFLLHYGYTCNDIALCMGLDEDTAKKNVKSLMELTGTCSRAQLKAYAEKFFDSSLQI